MTKLVKYTLPKVSQNWEGIWDAFTNPFFSSIIKTTSDIRDNISENDTHYNITVELPGLKKSEIQITYNNNKLIIKAENEKRNSPNHYYNSYYNEYLLDNIDENKIEAKLEDGILSVSLLKKSEIKELAGKQIEIK